MVTYRERLHAPASWWLMAAAFAGTWGWLLWVSLTATIGLVAALLVGAALSIALIGYGGVLVAVDDAELLVGPAHIAHGFLGAPEALDAAAFRAAMGPRADARAFVFTRPYLKTGVLVPILDNRDPAPYWLISTRHPKALCSAIRQTESPNDLGKESCGQEG